MLKYNELLDILGLDEKEHCKHAFDDDVDDENFILV